LLALLGGVCAVAAHASAAPAPTLFRLSITGTAHQEWTFRAAPVDTGDCRRVETSEGIRTVSFATKTPVTVRLSGGRLLPVTVGGIAGTVTLGGANTTDETCGEVGSGKTADCAQTRRSFANASLRMNGPRPGLVGVAAVANVRLARSDCPLEPADVQRRPLGALGTLLRLPQEALSERKLARITLHASRTQRKAYGAPESGNLVDNARWTLTFVRVPG